MSGAVEVTSPSSPTESVAVTKERPMETRAMMRALGWFFFILFILLVIVLIIYIVVVNNHPNRDDAKFRT